MASASIPQPILDAAAFAAITLVGRPIAMWLSAAVSRRFFPAHHARRQAMHRLDGMLNRHEELPGEELSWLETLVAALGLERAGLYAREPQNPQLCWYTGTHLPSRGTLAIERVEGGTALIEGYATGFGLTRHTRIVGYLVLGERLGGRTFTKRERHLIKQTCEQLALMLENRWLGRAVIDEHLAASRADEDRILQERVNAVVSHQLKTPILLSQSMLADARQAVTDRTRVARRLDKIAGALARFERNVIQNLDRHRLSEGPYALEVAPTPLGPVIVRCLDEVRYVLGKREASASLEVEPDLHVLADVARLEIVFDNLIGNALKVIPTGGSLRLRAVRVGETVRIDVSDDGPGIPPERLEGLFGVQPPNPEDPTSTGFGLAICRDYLLAMGGSIALLSNGPGGASFRIALRAA